LASDVFAAAAVFCARNAAETEKNLLPRNKRACLGKLAKHWVSGIRAGIDGEKRGLLLSLLDDDPAVRLLALQEVKRTVPGAFG